MSRALEKYLDRVMVYASRNEEDTVRIRIELEDHLLEKVAALEARGLSHKDALLRAIEVHGDAETVGYGLRRCFPLVDVRTKGTARGIIAIGPKAIGIIAIGGVAVGVLSYGGISFGFMSLGLLSLGLVISIGGFSLAPLGFAFGAIALGVMAAGLLSFGVTAIGVLAISLIYDPIYVSDCAKIISYFTLETAPYFLLHIKNIANVMGGWTWLPFYISCIIFLAVKLVLSRKERKRIKNADLSLVE